MTPAKQYGLKVTAALFVIAAAAAVFFLAFIMPHDASAATSMSYSGDANRIIIGVQQGPLVETMVPGGTAASGEMTLYIQSSDGRPVYNIKVSIYQCDSVEPLALLNHPRHMDGHTESLTTVEGGSLLMWHVQTVPPFGRPLSLKLRFPVPYINGVGFQPYPYLCMRAVAWSEKDYSSSPTVSVEWPTFGK